MGGGGQGKAWCECLWGQRGAEGLLPKLPLRLLSQALCQLLLLPLLLLLVCKLPHWLHACAPQLLRVPLLLGLPPAALPALPPVLPWRAPQGRPLQGDQAV